MSYVKRTDIALDTDEAVVELHNSQLVALRCERKRVASGVSYHAQARAINHDGVTKVDARGREIRTEIKHSLPMEIVDRIGDSVISRECLLLVLGYPATCEESTGKPIIQWSESVRASASISVSLNAESIAGSADVNSLL